jgi:DNA-binding transcriptional LysR family regulator
MSASYLSDHYSLAEVGRVLGVSDATVSRAVRAYEESVKCKT